MKWLVVPAMGAAVGLGVGLLDPSTGPALGLGFALFAGLFMTVYVRTEKQLYAISE